MPPWEIIPSVAVVTTIRTTVTMTLPKMRQEVIGAVGTIDITIIRIIIVQGRTEQAMLPQELVPTVATVRLATPLPQRL